MSTKELTNAPVESDVDALRTRSSTSKSRLILGLGVAAWLAARVYLFTSSSVWVLPDTGKYLPETNPNLTWDGRNPSPGWLVPWLYRTVVTNDSRTWLQFVIATLAWGLAALIFARLVTSVRRQVAIAVVVLLFSLSLPVETLDRVLQTESVGLSLCILWMAAWFTLLKKLSVFTLWPFLTSVLAALAILARPQVCVVVGPLTIALLGYVAFRRRQIGIVLAVSALLSIAATVWAPIALANFDKANSHTASRAYFFSYYRGTDPAYRQMEIEAGRPACPIFDQQSASVETASKQSPWVFFLDPGPNGYHQLCPELAAWHANQAPNYTQRLVQAPAATARLLLRDSGFLWIAWVRGDGAKPLGNLQATLFGISDQPGMANTEPQPGLHSWFDPVGKTQSPYLADGMPSVGVTSLLLWFVASIALIVVFCIRSRKRTRALRNRMFGGVVALQVVMLGGVLFAWVADAWEMDRHALPWTLLFRLMLVLGPLVSVGIPSTKLVSEEPQPTANAIVVVSACLSLLLGSLIGPQREAVPWVSPEAVALPTSIAEANARREQLNAIVFDTPADTPRADRIAVTPPTPEDAVPKGVLTDFSHSHIRVQLRNGLTSTGTLIQPKRQTGCSLIWLGGHAEWQTDATWLVDVALSRGCRVAALNMVLFGEGADQATSSSTQVMSIDGKSVTAVGPDHDHSWLSVLNSKGDNMLDLFATPTVSMVDWLSEQYPEDPIYVAGFSGGGWLTTLTAALDQRIRSSVAIAGSAEDVETQWCTADTEQCLPELTQHFSMTQLYYLSAFEGRTAVQALNVGDPCCNQAIQNPYWADEVNRALVGTGGGKFTYIADDATPAAHRVSRPAVLALDKLLAK